MNIIKTEIPEVLVIEPRIFGDARGFFYESFNQQVWLEKTGLQTTFVQDNHSRSEKNVLRGLHYQISQPQGKLVRVVRGAVFDVAVDIRRSSPTLGRWVGTRAFRRQSSPDVDSRRLRSRISGALRRCGVSLQNDRLLGPPIRTHDTLERPRPRNRLAVAKPTNPLSQRHPRHTV